MDEREAEFRRDMWRDADSGWAMTVELLTATGVWGVIGWLIDRWLDTEPWALAGGILLGFALGMYMVFLRAEERGRAEEAKRRQA